VEGSAPSEAEIEAAHGVRAPDTPEVMAHRGKEMMESRSGWRVVSAGKTEPQEDATSRNRRYVCRLFGTNRFKEGAMLHVHPLLGNGLVKKFPRRQILGRQSVTRLRNNRGRCVSYGFSSTSSAGNGPINSQSDT
jgi:hypothetical protein